MLQKGTKYFKFQSVDGVKVHCFLKEIQVALYHLLVFRIFIGCCFKRLTIGINAVIADYFKKNKIEELHNQLSSKNRIHNNNSCSGW